MRHVQSRVILAACLSSAALAAAPLCLGAAAVRAAGNTGGPGQLPLPVQTERFVLKPAQEMIGRVQMVRLKPHQVLADVARLFDVGYDAIKHANPTVNPWLAPPGTRVIVPTEFILPHAPHVGIVVNIAAMRLFYFLPHKPGQPQVVITHPVGIGRLGHATPTMVTRVTWHQAHPQWYVPRSILASHARRGTPLPPVVAAGPNNPLGNYALHLGYPEILIHGTDRPAGVGRRVSHGCIHLYPEDIKQIFKLVPNGTPVRVVNQPYLFAWSHGRLYMQAYGALQDDQRPWKTDPALLTRLLPRQWISDLTRTGQRIDWQRVRRLLVHPPVVPLPVSGRGAVHGGLVATLVQNRLPVGSAWNGRTHLPLTSAQLDAILAPRHAAAAPPRSRARRAP
jgi:L,D-transpeptidase ErfK/SrfK